MRAARILVGGALLAAAGSLWPAVPPTLAQPKPRPATPPKQTARAARTPARVSQQTIDAVADALAERSDYYWHRGDYDSVAFMNEMVVKLDPSDVTTWGNLAWIWWAGLNNDARAEQILKRGLAANPNRYEMYEELGQFYYRLKRYDEARDALKKAVGFKNAPALTWNQYAHALEQSGDPAAAARLWRSMLTRFPSFNLSQVNLDRLKRHNLIP